MRKWGTVVGISLLVGVVSLFAQDANTPKKGDATAAQLKRGKYLVEAIGMCNDCHTPMNERGEPVAAKHLQGAPLMFKATVPVPGWADRSANIAGLKGWTDEEAIKFFTTGISPNGKPAGPPMPQYRYTKSDAAAIIAYLRSLTPAAAQGSAK